MLKKQHLLIRPIKELRKELMKSYNVELLPIADDLDEVFNYILLNNLKVVNDVLDRIIFSLKNLESFPYAGAKITERSLSSFEFRMVISKPYISFYRVIGNTVYIYRILHGAGIIFRY